LCDEIVCVILPNQGTHNNLITVIDNYRLTRGHSARSRKKLDVISDDAAGSKGATMTNSSVKLAISKVCLTAEPVDTTDSNHLRLWRLLADGDAMRNGIDVSDVPWTCWNVNSLPLSNRVSPVSIVLAQVISCSIDEESRSVKIRSCL
jgi:hypothetical protein